MKRILRKAEQFISMLHCEWSLVTRQGKVPPVTISQSIRSWLLVLRSGPLPPVRGRFLITAFRNPTWIEWAVYSVCILRRYGFESTLVYDGKLAKKLYPENAWFPGFFSLVKQIPGIQLVDLNEEAKKSPSPRKWHKIQAEWAATALAYDLHLEEDDLKKEPEKYESRINESIERATLLAAGLDHYLSGRSFVRALCYSGLIGESKVLLDVLLSHKVETVCVEGWGWRPGHMIYNLNAPALEYNTKGWMEHDGAWDAKKEEEINKYFNWLDGDNYSDSSWLNNFYRVQRSHVKDTLPKDLADFLEGSEPVIILAPNVIADSSMLKRETIFSGQQEWIKEVIRWFADHPQYKLVIRAHPGEVWAGTKCIRHIGPYAHNLADGLPNVFVIDGQDKMNTFSLIPFASLGLIWISSAGVDFVIRGLPVIVAGLPKYAGLGITEEPKTKTAYFELLRHFADHRSRPQPDQVLQGKRYLHMVFKGFSFESFSPNYRANGFLIDHMPNPAEHDYFYQIMAGDILMPDVIPMK